MQEIKVEDKNRYEVVGDDIPNDTYIPSEEFEEFEYYIYDDEGNQLFKDRKFKAISREIENQMYWLYYEEIDIGTGKPYIIFTNDMLTPFWEEEKLTVEISNVEREKYNDTINIDYSIKNDYQTIFPMYPSGDIENIYGEMKLNGLWVDEEVTILVNGDEEESFDIILSPGKEKNGTISLVGEYVYSDISIEFIFEDIKSIKCNGQFYYPNNLKKEIILDTSVPDEIDINFNNNTEVITNIISEGTNSKKETISFTKIVKDIEDYPKTINQLFKMEYRIDGELTNLKISENIEAQIYMNGINEEYIKIDIDNESEGIYVFEINTLMYYDQENKVVEEGSSYGEYLDESGLVIPWDYEDNRGQIKFNLSIKTYTPMNFKFEINFGNENRLRGEGGEFYFSQIKYEQK